MSGACHAAQIAPLMKAVRVNDMRRASDGTRNPRHPISSPVAESRLWSVPSAMNVTTGVVNRFRSTAPSPVSHTNPYATPAYAKGSTYASANQRGAPGSHPRPRTFRWKISRVTIALTPGDHMSASTYRPPLAPRLPAAMMSPQNTALSAKVRTRKVTSSARFSSRSCIGLLPRRVGVVPATQQHDAQHDEPEREHVVIHVRDHSHDGRNVAKGREQSEPSGDQPAIS